MKLGSPAPVSAITRLLQAPPCPHAFNALSQGEPGRGSHLRRTALLQSAAVRRSTDTRRSATGARSRAGASKAGPSAGLWPDRPCLPAVYSTGRRLSPCYLHASHWSTCILVAALFGLAREKNVWSDISRFPLPDIPDEPCQIGSLGAG